MSSVAAGVGAAGAYAALDRLTSRPVRNFVALSVLVFLGMLIPVVTVTPSQGVSPIGQAVLVTPLAVVAVPLVAFVTGTVRL
jgi:peptidoglycan/LPS O-acetylase OafA/YrhL